MRRFLPILVVIVLLASCGITSKGVRLYSVYGKVQYRDGKPASGISIRLIGSVSKSATTSEDGSFEIDGVPNGEYTLNVLEGENLATSLNLSVNGENVDLGVITIPIPKASENSNLIAVITNDGTLMVIDVTDPSSPKISASTPVGMVDELPRKVLVDDGMIFALYEDGLVVYDADTLDRIKYISAIDAHDIDVSGTELILASYNEVEIYDTTNLMQVKSRTFSKDVYLVSKGENGIYALLSDGNLILLDDSLKEVKRKKILNESGITDSMISRKGKIFLISHQKLYVFDDLREIYEEKIYGNWGKMVIDGDRLYLASFPYEVAIYDISSSPKKIGVIAVDGAKDLFYKDGYLYVVKVKNTFKGEKILVYDVSGEKETTPITVGKMNTTDAYQIVPYEDYLLVAGKNGFKIFDSSSSPNIVYENPDWKFQWLDVERDTVFSKLEDPVEIGLGELVAVNLEDVKNPKIEKYGIKLRGKYLDEKDGIEVVIDREGNYTQVYVVNLEKDRLDATITYINQDLQNPVLYSRNLLYASYSGGVYVLSTGESTTATVISRVDISTGVKDLILVPGKLLTIGGEIQEYSTEDPTNLKFLEKHQLDSINSAAYSKGYLIVARGNDKVRLDTIKLDSFEMVNETPLDVPYVKEIAVIGDKAFLRTDEGITIVENIFDSSTPTLIYEMDVPAIVISK